MVFTKKRRSNCPEPEAKGDSEENEPSPSKVRRFNSINKDKGPKSSWAEKMKRKQEQKDLLAIKNSITEEKKRKKSELRERQRLNIVRKEENARKSEIVQVIKDSRKIKKMKRKQLRYIETRDTNQMK